MQNFSYTQPYVVVGAFIVQDGKVLLIQENHPPDAGTWNLPAGKLDFGEDPIAAAKREAYEEAGIEFTPTALLGIHSVHRKDVGPDDSQQIHAIRIIYLGTATGEVNLEHGDPLHGVAEISDFQWLSPAEILALDLSELRYHDIKLLVENYLKDIKHPLDTISHIQQS